MSRRQLTYWLIAGWLAWGAAAHGQYTIVRPVSTNDGPTVSGFVSGWHDLKPERSADPRLGKVLGDIESHMPAGHIYRDPDLVTWAHETTHGINSRVRCHVGGMVNAFYCLNNFVGIYREPRLRKSIVCRYVPTALRGDVWGLYMAGQTEWDDRPLYILDEWIAYINGAEAGRELKARGMTGNRSIEADVRHSVEFAGYASALLVCIDKHDPQYVDKDKLSDFIAYNLGRTLKLTHSPQQVRVFEVHYCPDGNCQGRQCGPLQWMGNCWRPQRQPVAQQPKQQAPQPPLVPVPSPSAVVQQPTAKCNCDPTIPSRLAKIEATLVKLAENQSGCKCDNSKIDSRIADLEAKLEASRCKCKPTEPAQPKADEVHVVVVADQNAPYWQRLSEIIESTKKTYHGVQVAPLPDFPIGLHPQAVVYKNSVPVRVVKGQYQVEALLSRLSRGESV